MFKQIFFLLFILGGIINSSAQLDKFRPLQIGDTLPDLAITICIGDSVRNTHLSEYKGKLLLLDFWTVYCLSCIEAMPYMLDLQKRFGDKIQIILITQNSDEDVKKLGKKLERSPSALQHFNARTHLPLIKHDSVLSTLIPYKSVPTHAWIDGNRVLRAVTYGTSTTKENIKGFLEGTNVQLDHKRLADLKLDNPLSWLDDEIIDANNVTYYSFFTNHIEYGNWGSTFLQTIVDPFSEKIVGVKCMNKSILQLYKLAYDDYFHIKPVIPNNRIIIKTKDSLRFFPPASNFEFTKWLKSNTFCYALKLPSPYSDQVYPTMRKDLDRFFNISSTVQKREVKCMILKKISKGDRIHTLGTEEKFESDSGKLIIRNKPMEQLFLDLSTVIEAQFPNLVFIDETNYKKKIDIELDWSRDRKNISFEGLRSRLHKYGLDLVVGYRMMDMLVIRDKKQR